MELYDFRQSIAAACGKRMATVVAAVALTAFAVGEVAGPAPAAAPVVITVAHVLSTLTLMHQELEKWAQHLEQQSGGQVQVKIVPNGQLGTEPQLDLDVVKGVIQMEDRTTNQVSLNTRFAPVLMSQAFPHLLSDTPGGPPGHTRRRDGPFLNQQRPTPRSISHSRLAPPASRESRCTTTHNYFSEGRRGFR